MSDDNLEKEQKHETKEKKQKMMSDNTYQEKLNDRE